MKRVKTRPDVVSNPYAVPEVRLIVSEFLKLESLQLLRKLREKVILRVRKMQNVVFGTELDLAAAPKVK